ncbi:cytochrome b [Pseudomonas baetica]|nr:cytochrome b [Pseudomonas baetica]
MIKSEFADVNVSRYDTISRRLHWLMALLFAWIYCSAAAHYLLSDTALDKLLWPYHKSIGLVLFVLLIVRVGWSIQRKRYRPKSISFAASIGHKILYTLMFIIPLVGLLRQYGSGRAFSAFGLPVMGGFEGEKIQWMIDLGSDFHSLLGWVMALLVLAHVGAVARHYRRGELQVLRRMFGNAQED